MWSASTLLSQEMMLYEDAASLIRELPRIIDRIFALEGVVLYSRDEDLFFSSTSELPMSIQASLSAVSMGLQPTHALPGDFTAMPLVVGMRPVGALGWRPATLSREVATAMTAQVAIALTRAVAIEASARLEAAREGERLRTALIDSMTHELRTPLTSIRAAATTLLQGEGLDEAAQLDLVAIVDEESSRLDALIGEAVEMAEIDANVVQVHAEPQSHARFWNRQWRSRRQCSPRITWSSMWRSPTTPCGSIRICWAACSPSARECGALLPAGQPHRVAQPPRRRQA